MNDINEVKNADVPTYILFCLYHVNSFEMQFSCCQSFLLKKVCFLHDIFHASMISFSILTLQFYTMKDLVIEMLRSIAELMTYGDQHDPSYFEYVTLLKSFSPFSYVGIF